MHICKSNQNNIIKKISYPVLRNEVLEIEQTYKSIMIQIQFFSVMSLVEIYDLIGFVVLGLGDF